jgi:hypothetical protein
MVHFRILSSSLSALALGAFALAAPAHAESRSGKSLPAVTYSKPAPVTVSGKPGKGHGDRDLPTHVGPKKGFPDNRGIKEAFEHSNEHSAHHRDRDDSPGC